MSLFRAGWACLVGLALVFSGLVSSLNAAEPPSRAKTFSRVLEVHQRNAERLLALKDVVGTAAGTDRHGNFAVKVYGKKGVVAGVPRTVEEVPVVVEATGEFYALQWPPRWPQGRPPSLPDLRPAVLLLTPHRGATLSGDVRVSALAFDDRGLNGVEFFVDGVSLGKDLNGTDGWSTVWDTTEVADGQHRVTATAIDTAGQRSSDHARVTVDNEELPPSPDGRPAPIGVSTGNANECSAGTIGCRVKDVFGNVYALSNNHVYARMNAARLGEQVVQPGLIDSNCQLQYSDQVIGRLADFARIDFRSRGSNTIDAAIALASPGSLGKATPGDGYGVPKATPVAASFGQSVQKYGRTTGLTAGAVSGLDATIVVNYGDRTARFTGQIIVSGPQGFIDAGDSGSLLVTAAGGGGREPVGLLFAGTEDGATAIANPIQSVLTAFGVAIDGE